MPQATITRRRDLDRMQQRVLEVRADSWDSEKRTLDVRWTGGADVLRYDWRSDTQYWERLDFSASAVDTRRLKSGQMPVYDNHRTWEGSRGVIGVVDAGDVDNQKRTGDATLRFTSAEDAQPVITRIREKVVSNWSFGYSRQKIDKTTGEMRDGIPVWYVRKWRIEEISAAPIPADDATYTRGGGEPQGSDGGWFSTCEFEERTMPPDTIETTKTEAEQAARKAEAERKQAAEAEAQRAAEAARAAEAERQTEVRRLCTRHKLEEKFADELLKRTPFVSLDAARKEILGELEKRDAATDTRGQHGGGTGAEVGETESEKFQRIAADGLLLRQGRFANRTSVAVETRTLKEDNWIEQRQPLDGAREFAGMRLSRLAEICLRRSGVDTTRMTESQIHDAVLSRSVAPAHGTADFPLITKNVANKALRMGYMESPRTFLPLVRNVGVNDFKPRQVHGLSTAPDLKKISQNGEVYYGTLGETGQTYAISSYGVIFAITRVALINDDTEAFERMPYMFGLSGARLESDIVWALRTAEQVIDETGLALYAGGHANTGTGAISVAAINAGMANMALKRAPSAPDGTLGAILNVMPRYLVVPVGLWATAVQFTAALTPQQASNVNPFGPSGPTPLIPISEPRLDAESTAEWYLDAQPGSIDTMETATLSGQEGVYLEQRIGFERDGLELKARHDFGASWIDFRGTYRSSGV